MDFKEGDVVKLKSGGPEMTISEIIKNEEALCIWFIGNELKKDIFNICTIEKCKIPDFL